MWPRVTTGRVVRGLQTPPSGARSGGAGCALPVGPGARRAPPTSRAGPHPLCPHAEKVGVGGGPKERTRGNNFGNLTPLLEGGRERRSGPVYGEKGRSFQRTVWSPGRRIAALPTHSRPRLADPAPRACGGPTLNKSDM